MNSRIISKILSKKHDEFVESITDKDVKKLIDKNSIITGGSIVSLLLNEQVKDFDYYFTDKETCKKVAEYFVDKFHKEYDDTRPSVQEENGRIKIVVPSAGIVGSIEEADETDSEPMEDINKDKGIYRVIFMSSNAITLSDKIQTVIRFYGDAKEIHKNYDFVHCTNYWTSKDKKLTLRKEALECILTRQLQYQGSIYPVCSVIRTRKFLKSGWHINAGQFLKMCFQISELDLNNIKVLEEQLTGVDAAYFFQVIDYCKKKQLEDSMWKITTPYLISIIDKIFG